MTEIEKNKNSSSKTSWFWWPFKTTSASNGSLEKDNESDMNTSYDDKEILNDEGQEELSDFSPLDEEPDFVPNPEVEEIFKNFPQYYREKAIKRYSKREGILRVDLAWYYYMGEERSLGMQGKFKEDKRFDEEAIKEAKNKDIAKAAIENKQRREAEGEENQFEKTFSRTTGIPLQDEDSVREKLIELGALFFGGFGFLHNGWTYERRHHFFKPKWMVRARKMGAVGLWLFMSGFCTYYRFTDTGYFDRSVDKRRMLDQLEDNLSNDFADKVLDLFGNEKGTNSKSN